MMERALFHVAMVNTTQTSYASSAQFVNSDAHLMALKPYVTTEQHPSVLLKHAQTTATFVWQQLLMSQHVSPVPLSMN